MEKQFEIIEKLFLATKESESRITELRNLIESEHFKIRAQFVDLYPHNLDIIYLIQFDNHSINFYKATKENLYEIRLSWFRSKIKLNVPKNAIEGKKLILEMNNPTNCEIHGYREFGYFDDIHKRFDRIDWITESIMERNFLFEITKDEFDKSINLVSEFYTK